MANGDEFGDWSFAARFRDWARGEIRRMIGQERPVPRYGTVTGWDRATRICYVQYAGDTPVQVKMGCIQPSVIGQQVRVEGPPNDRYVADVTDGQCFIDNDPTAT